MSHLKAVLRIRSIFFGSGCGSGIENLDLDPCYTSFFMLAQNNLFYDFSLPNVYLMRLVEQYFRQTDPIFLIFSLYERSGSATLLKVNFMGSFSHFFSIGSYELEECAKLGLSKNPGFDCLN